MHEGHWDLANPFPVEITSVHQIFIKHLICSCHFARPTDGNVKIICIKKCKKCRGFDLQENRYRGKKRAHSHG